jgi:RNA recognition motif-containing protein
MYPFHMSAQVYKELDRYQDNESPSIISEGNILFIGGVPKTWTYHDVVKYFSPFGIVTKVEFIFAKKQKRSKNQKEEHRGCGKVEFLTHYEAKRAAEYKRHSYNGVDFQVRLFVPENIRKEKGKLAIKEKRKIIVIGIPRGYPKGKICLHLFLKGF